MQTEIELTKELRAQKTCRRCGGEKTHGPHAQIVCSNCWHEGHHSNKIPFKFYSGTLQSWLKL